MLRRIQVPPPTRYPANSAKPSKRSTPALDLRTSLAEVRADRLTGTHWPPEGFDEARLEAWYASSARLDDRLDLAVVDRATGDVAGEVVLNELDRENRSCNFRIYLASEGNRGRGLGTEATRLMLAHAFETVGLHRVALEVYVFNPRARRVYEKTGFVYEGTMRQSLLWDGA